jgi:chromosome segregation ATPase
VTKDLTKVIDDLGKELDSDKTIGTLRERIDGFDLELETNVNAAMDDLREEHDEEMDDLRLELEGLQDILIQRAIELREASDKVKRREKTIIEHEKTIKKLTVKQKKAERFVCLAFADYVQSR